MFPDVIDTLEKLKDKGILCTIATSRNSKSLKEFLNKMNVAQYFTYVIAAEDTSLLKPNPEPVIKTLNDLAYPAEQTIVVGDMPIDIQMGKKAGVYTCGVTYGNSDRNKLIEAGADYVIDRISELFDIL